jgi:predicted HAD superfamily Cof-like phosphohydrolase
MSTKAPDLLGQALQFRIAMDQPIAAFAPSILDIQSYLIDEEACEFFEAYDKCIEDNQNTRARIDALKELADLVYVCFQFAAAAGWELDEALARVHTSNMSKLVDGKPLKNEQGKVLKGPNYKPPFLDDLI